jgi:hypothetical protein
VTNRHRRPDLGDFELDGLYMHSHTRELVQYIGEAWVHELCEDVGVFSVVLSENFVIATRRGYDQGETFQPFGDAVDDTRRSGGDW